MNHDKLPVTLMQTVKTSPSPQASDRVRHKQQSHSADYAHLKVRQQHAGETQHGSQHTHPAEASECWQMGSCSTLGEADPRLVSGQILTLTECAALAHVDREKARVSVTVATRTNKPITDVNLKLLGKETPSHGET